MTDTHIKYLEQFVPLAGASVIDVDGGHETFLRQLLRRKARVTSVRSAPPAKAAKGLDILAGKPDALPLADGDADLVVYLMRFHHVGADLHRRALAEASRVLRPGGRLHVVEPFSEGSYFDLMKHLDDQTELRAKALSALAEAGAVGLRPMIAGTYIHVERFAHFDDFRTRAIVGHPVRERAFAIHERAVREAFTNHGIVEDDGKVLFRQLCRMYHFSRKLDADQAA
jgi:SAM-dependent methyltransferase